MLYSFHLTLVTFAVCVLYCYRDIWPLMTFTLRPADEAEGDILWAKIALLIFVSTVEPLFEPYPYIPVDPTVMKAVSDCSHGPNCLSLGTDAYTQSRADLLGHLVPVLQLPGPNNLAWVPRPAPHTRTAPPTM